MIHSYISEHKYERLNLLLDQYCHRCAEIHAHPCEGCELSHRKDKVVIPFNPAPNTEQARIEVSWMRIVSYQKMPLYDVATIFLVLCRHIAPHNQHVRRKLHFCCHQLMHRMYERHAKKWNITAYWYCPVCASIKKDDS